MCWGWYIWKNWFRLWKMLSKTPEVTCKSPWINGLKQPLQKKQYHWNLPTLRRSKRKQAEQSENLTSLLISSPVGSGNSNNECPGPYEWWDNQHDGSKQETKTTHNSIQNINPCSTRSGEESNTISKTTPATGLIRRY